MPKSLPVIVFIMVHEDDYSLPVIVFIMVHEDEAEIDMGTGDVLIKLQYTLKVRNGILKSTVKNFLND